MWHIMCKVIKKVGLVLAKNDDFRRKINGIVWSHYISPQQFEDDWHRIMEEFGLADHNWFMQILICGIFGFLHL